MNPHEDDQSLVDASLAGDQDAFGFLVRRYQGRLYPMILRMTGCAEDAHDMIQDTFIRAFEKLPSFHGESSFYTWLYRIAVNLTLSHERREKLAKRFVMASRMRQVTEPARDVDPSAALERTEQELLIQRALNQLPSEYRSVIVMKDLEQMRYEEIANILGIPIGTVRSRLHRARSELRERLRGVKIEETVRTPS